MWGCFADINTGANGIPLSEYLNAWHHIIYVYDGNISNTKIYYDGNNLPLSSVEGNQTSTLNTINTKLTLGNFSVYSSNAPWMTAAPNSKISDVRIYDRALDTNEVAWLHSLESTPFEASNNGSTVTVTAYNGPGGPVTIPSSFNGLPVTAIAESAFAGQSNITSISIPDGVISIGSSAFSGCTGLTGITLPDSVISMGMNVFAGCPNLTNVSTSNGLKTFLSQYASELGLSAVAVNNFYSTTESQLYAMVATSLAGNASFLSSLGTNTSFLGALSGKILATTNNYGLATKADLAALSAYVTNTALPSLQSSLTGLVQQSLPTNNGYLTAVATNPAFIEALVSQASFLNTTATNTTFVASLTTNPVFLNALAAQIAASPNNLGLAVKLPQTLTFSPLPTVTYSSKKVTTIVLKATSSANLTSTTFTISNPSVGIIQNSKMIVMGQGTTTVTATNSGNGIYTPASATQTLIVK